MSRHRDGEAQQGRNPKLPNHSRILLCDPAGLLALVPAEVNDSIPALRGRLTAAIRAEKWFEPALLQPHPM
jgi:hypothetical protein